MQFSTIKQQQEYKLNVCIAPIGPHLISHLFSKGCPCRIIICSNTMVMITIWLPSGLKSYNLIYSMIKNPVMKNATCKDQLYLSLVRMEGLVVNYAKPIFVTPKALSILVLLLECLKLKSSLALVGEFLPPYSLRWYLVPLNGGRNPGRQAYPASTR